MVPAHVRGKVALLLAGVATHGAAVAGLLAALVPQVHQHVLAVAVGVAAPGARDRASRTLGQAGEEPRRLACDNTQTRQERQQTGVCECVRGEG